MLLPPQSLLSAGGGGSSDKEEVGQDSSQGSKMANYSFEQQVKWLKDTFSILKLVFSSREL